MNMTQMARSESYESPAERLYTGWLIAVIDAVGADVNESNAWDLYRGDYTVAQAVAELSAGFA